MIQSIPHELMNQFRMKREKCAARLSRWMRETSRNVADYTAAQKVRYGLSFSERAELRLFLFRWKCVGGK